MKKKKQLNSNSGVFYKNTQPNSENKETNNQMQTNQFEMIQQQQQQQQFQINNNDSENSNNNIGNIPNGLDFLNNINNNNNNNNMQQQQQNSNNSNNSNSSNKNNNNNIQQQLDFNFNNNSNNQQQPQQQFLQNSLQLPQQSQQQNQNKNQFFQSQVQQQNQHQQQQPIQNLGFSSQILQINANNSNQKNNLLSTNNNNAAIASGVNAGPLPPPGIGVSTNNNNFMSKSHRIGDLIFPELTDVTHSSIQTEVINKNMGNQQQQQQQNNINNNNNQTFNDNNNNNNTSLLNNQSQQQQGDQNNNSENSELDIISQQFVQHLDLVNFKAFPCKIGQQHNHKHCSYFHNAKDRKRPGNFYSSDLCEFIDKNQNCPYFDMCTKSHNRVEQLYQPDKYKTKFCTYFPYQVDQCDYGIFCSFSHSENDILIDLIHNYQYDFDFYMFFFKTVMCPFNLTPHDKALCIYAHNWQDYRRKPNMYNYLPIACENWKATEYILNYEDGCINQYNCQKCHGWKELEYHPKNYKTKHCQNYRNCTKGQDCPNYHSQKDRLVQPKNIASNIFRLVPKNRIIKNTFKIRQQNQTDQQDQEKQQQQIHALNKQLQHQKNGMNGNNNNKSQQLLVFPSMNSNNNFNSNAGLGPNIQNIQQQPFSASSFTSFNVQNNGNNFQNIQVHEGQANINSINVFNNAKNPNGRSQDLNGSQNLQGSGSQTLLDPNLNPPLSSGRGALNNNLLINNQQHQQTQPETDLINNNNWLMESNHNSDEGYQDTNMSIFNNKSMKEMNNEFMNMMSNNNNNFNKSNNSGIFNVPNNNNMNSSQTFLPTNPNSNNNNNELGFSNNPSIQKTGKKLGESSIIPLEFQISEQDDEDFSEKKQIKRSNSQLLESLKIQPDQPLNNNNNNQLDFPSIGLNQGTNSNSNLIGLEQQLQFQIMQQQQQQNPNNNSSQFLQQQQQQQQQQQELSTDQIIGLQSHNFGKVDHNIDIMFKEIVEEVDENQATASRQSVNNNNEFQQQQCGQNTNINQGEDTNNNNQNIPKNTNNDGTQEVDKTNNNNSSGNILEQEKLQTYKKNIKKFSSYNQEDQDIKKNVLNIIDDE